MTRVADLSGAELDFWVARAEKFTSAWIAKEDGEEPVCILGTVAMNRFEWCPSTCWAQGGEIIERERIGIWPGTEEQPHHHVWTACIPSDDGTFDDLKECYGATPLEAAMRCFVASVYGDEVSDEREG